MSSNLDKVSFFISNLRSGKRVSEQSLTIVSRRSVGVSAELASRSEGIGENPGGMGRCSVTSDGVAALLWMELVKPSIAR